jgi:Phosphotransferase enzyme family
MNGGIRDSDVARVIHRAAGADPDLQANPPIPIAQAGKELANALLCRPEDFVKPHKLFDRIRWGGQVIFIGEERDAIDKVAAKLAENGFEITQPPGYVSRRWLGVAIPLISKRIYFVVARKIALILPGQTTDRFTFHVHLVRGASGEYEVVKEVPTKEMVIARLRSKWPDLAQEVVEKRARKFTDKIFPVFLTREAAILKIVYRDLPENYRCRIPRLLDMEKDERGFARRLHLSWLRNGGEPLTQTEFARQSADLLRALHDEAGIMHLDLRLDNFVITPAGVGFVDFGSAVRVDENLKESPLLSSLFEELMRTSEIQRMLFRMTRTGEVTSEAISGGLHKADKAVDYFYLAVQISSPHANPDLKDLIRYEKGSDESRRLSQLTEQILRPVDPSKPKFRSAADILEGIIRLQRSTDVSPSAVEGDLPAHSEDLSKTAPPC